MTKRILQEGCHSFVNAYYGKHGKTDFSKYDSWKKYTFGIDEGYYGIKGKDIHLILQGTDENLEWRGHKSSNLNFWHKTKIWFGKRFLLKTKKHYGSDKKIKVHPGFLDGYNTGRNFFLQLASRYKNIYIEVHSRGAGIGTIAARDIQWHIDNVWKTKQKVILISGGSPRVYNKYGAKEFDNSKVIHYRLKYRNDIVCNVPWPIFGYRHCGKLITLGKPYIWSPIGIPWDHAPQNYIKGMRKYTKVII